MSIDFNFFLSVKDSVIWKQVRTWSRSKGTQAHLIWQGFRPDPNGILETIPSFFLYLSVDKASDKIRLSLAANVGYDMKGSKQQVIDKEDIGGLVSFENGAVEEVMTSKYGLSGSTTMQRSNAGYNPTVPPKYQKVVRTYFSPSENMVKSIYLNEVKKREETIFVVRVITINASSNKIVNNTRYSESTTVEEGSQSFAGICKEIEKEGYRYIGVYKGELPAVAKLNFNTVFTPEAQDVIQKEFWSQTVDDMFGFEDEIDDEWNVFGSSKPFLKTSQVGGQWYNGQMPNPDQIAPNIGTPNVDSSQIESIFNGTREAINLVNQYNSQLLSPVAWIYNSSGNAFGVYVPEIDEALKNSAVKKYMENSGYRVETNPQGGFTAFPGNDTVPEEKIRQDMDTAYSQIQMQGGNSLGLNVNQIIDAAQKDINDIGTDDPTEQQQLRILHLAGTMVHEAVHAKGAKDEGGPESEEKKFMQWALNKINQERQAGWNVQEQGEFTPFVIDFSTTRQASTSTWYRKSQYGAQFSTLNPNARFPDNYMQFSQNPGKGIMEGLLNDGRNMMKPYEGRPIERKMRERQKERWDDRPDTNLTTEELLEKDRKSLQAYKHTEEQMEDQRPKPLMVPVKKSASMQKVAGFFSEPDIFNSHGTRIQGGLVPTMRERVITREDSDDFLNFDWGSEGRNSPNSNSDSYGTGGAIHEQPRYNPEYSNGFYQKIREPRWAPELWDDMLSERPTRTNPAGRWASTLSSDPSKEDMEYIAEVLEAAEYLIEHGLIKGTRFLASEDVADGIEKFYDGKGVNIFTPKSIGKYKGEVIIPVWVLKPGLDEDLAIKAERFMRGDSKDLNDQAALEEICNVSDSPSSKESTIDSIISAAQEVCHKYGIEGAYIVGGFPRAMAMQDPKSSVKDLDFSAAWPEECTKLGGILAETLGVKDSSYYHRTMTLSWEWNGIKCDFRGDLRPVDVRDLMRNKGIRTTALNLDVYSRDLTINMFVYSLNDERVYDVSGKSLDAIKNKTISTYFDPETTIKRNPLVILRALKFAVRYGFKIDPPLERAISQNSHLLFGGKLTDERLAAGMDDLIAEGKEEADYLIRKMGLDQLYEIKKKVAKED